MIEGADVDVQEFLECIDFARSYADKHHHGKEEQILFRFMLDRSDSAAEKMVRNGMLVEHDLGRYHIGELEKALKQCKRLISGWIPSIHRFSYNDW